jgi:hypothetical protein
MTKWRCGDCLFWERINVSSYGDRPLAYWQNGFSEMCVVSKRLLLHQYVPDVNLLKPTGYVMHQQFNIQQLYALHTLYLCVLHLSENKQRLVPLTA